MWFGIVFIILGWLLTLLAFASLRGAVLAMIVMVIAIGLAAIGLYVLQVQNVTQYGGTTATSSKGISMSISSYSVTNAQNSQSQSLGLLLGEMDIIVETALTFLVVGYLFWGRRQERKKRYNA
jgi:hypothetical protein